MGFLDEIDTTTIIIISTITLLNYYLSINEYYSNKAYWAYYHVQVMYRKDMRSGFNAIYLSVAIIVLSLFGTIMFGIYSYWEKIEKNWEMWCCLFCVGVSIVLYIFLRIMIWKIHLVDYNERRAWDSKLKHSNFVKMKAKLLFFEYGISIDFIICGMFICMNTKEFVLIIPILVCTLVYMQFQSYSNQLRLLDYRKWIEIIKIDDKDYALIEVGTGWVYLIECKENSIDNELELILDNFRIFNSDCIDVQTKYYNKISRVCNLNTCNERFIMKRRK